ncbi:MAG TPA: hypothetical protein VGL80_04800 [Pseudonocardiaceae bacterium]
MADSRFGAGDEMDPPDGAWSQHAPWQLTVLRVARAVIVSVLASLTLFIALAAPVVWDGGAHGWSALGFVVVGVALVVALWLVADRLLFRRIPRRKWWLRQVPEDERRWRVQPARRGGVPRHSKRGHQER